MTDVWQLVHAERRALVEDLAQITDEQWASPSLCGGWTVHDVAAHLVDNARTTRLGIIAAMVRARFDFDRQNDAGVAREQGATPAETLDRLRAVAGRRTTPPAPLDSRLVEEVVHGEDVRRPLGLRRDYPVESVGGPWPTSSGRPSGWVAGSSGSVGSAWWRPMPTGPTARATRSVGRWCPSS